MYAKAPSRSMWRRSGIEEVPNAAECCRKGTASREAVLYCRLLKVAKVLERADMKFLAVAAGAFISISVGGSIAQATDLPLRAMAVKAMPVKAPPPIEAYSWSGFYLGANLGYGWADDNDPVTFTSNAGVLGTGVGPGSAQGAFGGGQIGYNWQFGRFVLGAEADIQGSGLSNSTGPAVIVGGGGTTLTATQELNWFYTVRGRAGFTYDRALFYVTGGFAGGDVNDTAFLANGGASATLVGGNSRTGYVIGGGIEYAFTPVWSAKAEYQHIDLGTRTLTGAVVPVSGMTVSTTAIADRFDTVRVGVNYHPLNWR